MFAKIFRFLKTLTMFAKIFKFLKTLTMFAEFLKILRNFDYVCRVSEKFGTKSHNEKKSLRSRYRGGPLDISLCISKKIATLRHTNQIICPEKRKKVDILRNDAQNQVRIF